MQFSLCVVSVCDAQIDVLSVLATNSNSSVPVVNYCIVFTAVDEVVDDHGDKLKVVEISTDDNPITVADCKVSTLQHDIQSGTH